MPQFLSSVFHPLASLSSVSSFRALVRMIDLPNVQLLSVMGRRVCEGFSADFDPPLPSFSIMSVRFQPTTQLEFADSVLHRDSPLLSHLGQGSLWNGVLFPWGGCHY